MARRDGLLSLGARKPLCVEDPVAVRTAVRSRVKYELRNLRFRFPEIANSELKFPYVRVSRDRAAPTAGGDRRPRRRRRGALGPTTLARISRGVPGRVERRRRFLVLVKFLICRVTIIIRSVSSSLGQPNGRSAAPARTDASSISSSIMVLGAIRAPPRSGPGGHV